MDRRPFACLLATIVLALTGCGGGGGGDDVAAAPPGSPLAAGPSPGAPPASGSGPAAPAGTGSPAATGSPIAGTGTATGSPSASGAPVAVPPAIVSGFSAFGPVTIAVSNGPQPPAVARFASGGSLVVWQLFEGPLQMQRVDAGGLAVGTPITIAATGSASVQPAIVPLAGGNFVVLWADATSAGATSRVLMRGFDANGAATTPLTQVSTAVTSVTQMDAALLPDGGFVVAWAGTQLVGGASTVAVQRFDANAAPVAQSQLASPATAGAQRQPRLAVLPDGSHAVAWLQEGGSAGLPSFTVNLQRFASDGAALGAERVVAGTAASVTFPFDLTALSNGRLALVWQSFGATQGAADLHLQLLASDGSPLAAPSQVAGASGTAVFDPHVASLGTSGFVLTWEQGSVVTIRQTDATVFAQRFANDGTPLDAAQSLGAHALQTTTGQASGASSLAAGTDGHFLLAYDRWLGGSFIDLLGR